MAQWLGAWLSYYRQLYHVGVIILVFAALAAFMSFLYAIIPALAIGWALGWEIGDTEFAIVAALLFFPAVLGGVTRYADGAREPLPKRPPPWEDWKIGIRGDYKETPLARGDGASGAP